MAQNTNRLRVLEAVTLLFTLALAVWIGVRLDSFGVPIGLIIPCSLAILSSGLQMLAQLTRALAGTLHRCTEPGCSFEVRVQNVDAAENRRWQEIAAAHPAHDYV
ncbi:hypothetical protein GTW43_29280 [Streptomyces sp. SID5785]|uniref:hypothetical protein n=1 Tax=Streptomyces sp. SID5785 TaxID=2690309 RepID=UPI001361446C|nr:hypothetical protein [Streptomyces sp. SID5785]MZD09141.1 hypothetical protein [Streptomyces sp. SID5785]